MISQGYSKILVIIDQATCHKKLTESYDLIEKGIHVLYIPGRMTGFLQPADVGWFAAIKKCYSCNKKNNAFRFSIMLMGPHLKKKRKRITQAEILQDFKKKLAEANKNNKTMTKELLEKKSKN